LVFFNRTLLKRLFKIQYSILLLLFLLTLIISNCSKSKSDNHLNEDQFVDILAELMITEQLKIGHTEKVSLVKQIFKKHNISSKEFSTYKKEHENDPQYWIDIYKKVEKRIKQLSNPNKHLKLKNNSKRDANAPKN